MKQESQDSKQMIGTAQGGSENGNRWKSIAISVVLLAAAVLAGSLSPLVEAQTELWPDDVVPFRVVISFEGGVPDELPAYISELGGEVVMEEPYLPFVVVDIDPATSQTLINRALADERITGAEYDGYVYPLQFFPDDLLWSLQFSPHNAVDLPEAWNITLGSHNIDIHILDTGMDYTHADLLPNAVCGLPGADFVTNWAGLGVGSESGFHGTHVAGIASAATDNAMGVAGASQSCLTSVRVLAAATGMWSWLAGGIYWSAAHGAEIISMSLGGSNPPGYVGTAVDDAEKDGVLLIAAAGNDGCGGGNNVGHPAKYSQVMAVAALTNSGTNWASYSSCGSEVEISAPGSSIWSTLPGNTYGPLDGTSMATPLVSGIAGLVWSQNTTLTNDQVRCILVTEATPMPGISASKVGAGRIDADDAVIAAANPADIGC